MAYNVLIVDDSAAMRMLISKVLDIARFDIGACFEAGNGQEALKILENNWVDIIICDLHMPEMDGAAFLEAMRAHKLWRSIPVVLVTTESREYVVSPLLKHLAQGYIKKPFRPETIRSQLAAILGEAYRPDVRELEGRDF
ncbi:MAG: response regulator [Deltaproteobacteria bacterium]|nr:response regulator [Deltaproteobacteria bacterium]